MDTVRSYQAVLAANVVDAELFPDISFGEAPEKQTAENLAPASHAQELALNE